MTDAELLSRALTALDALLSEHGASPGRSMGESMVRQVAEELRAAGVKPARGEVRRVNE